ncbi:MAG: VOC family protein [Acidimicrobiales bacterium]
MAVVHHSGIVVRDLDTSLRFWRDGIGLAVLMDEHFDGDWPTLFDVSSTRLRAVFLGDPARPDAGVVELVGVDGATPAAAPPPVHPRPAGFLLLSVLTDVDATLTRLDDLGLGGEPRRVSAHGVAMAVVRDPDGVLVELVHDTARANLDRLMGG